MRRLLSTCAAAIALGTCAWWIATASLERELDRRLLALRRHGEPVGRHAFAAAGIAPEDDAAPLYREFLEWIDAHPYDYAWVLEEALDDAAVAAMLAWRREAIPAIETLDAASRKPACSHRYDLELPAAQWVIELLPVAQEVREIATIERQLTERGLWAAEDRLAGARRTWRIARHLDDRLALGWLFRSLTEGLALGSVRRLAGARAIDTTRLRSTVSEWARGTPARPVREVLAYERAGAIDTVLTIADTLDRWEYVAPDLPGWLVTSGFWRPFRTLDALERLDAFDQAAALLEHPAPEELRRLRAWRDEGPARRWYQLMPSWIRYVAPKLARERLRRAAWMRITRTGLDLLLHREWHGIWPRDLADLPHATDPFTGGPLVYERLDDGGVRLAARDPDPDEDEPLAWRIAAP